MTFKKDSRKLEKRIYIEGDLEADYDEGKTQKVIDYAIEKGLDLFFLPIRGGFLTITGPKIYKNSRNPLHYYLTINEIIKEIDKAYS